MTLPTRQLDNRVQIVTPENIAFEYQAAGPFRRLGAYLLDLFIRFVVLVLGTLALVIAFGSVGFQGFGIGLTLFLYFLLDWFYGGLFETFWNGQTPGKRLLHIRVIATTGQPINPWQAVLRNVLRSADAMPVIGIMPTYMVGLVAAACNDRFQRLGDLACGTMVVVEEPQRKYGVLRINDPGVISLAACLPANFEVSRSLGRALSSYVERRGRLSQARRDEIARHLGEPMKAKFNPPPQTSNDLLLCALYHQAFIADRSTADAWLAPVVVATAVQ